MTSAPALPPSTYSSSFNTTFIYLCESVRDHFLIMRAFVDAFVWRCRGERQSAPGLKRRPRSQTV